MRRPLVAAAAAALLVLGVGPRVRADGPGFDRNSNVYPAHEAPSEPAAGDDSDSDTDGAPTAAEPPATLPSPPPPPQAPPAPAAGDAAQGKAGAADDYSAWIRTLEQSEQRVKDLRARVAILQTMVDKSVSRRYPSGPPKAKMISDLAQAKQDLAEAEARHPDLLEQARHAGVPPGILQQYELDPSS
jgi:hypothetical protein